MATKKPHLPSLDPELIAGYRDLAEQAADRLTEFLRDLEADGVRLIPFPRHFLLELGAALTLASWERGGILIHRDAGLPPAVLAVRQALNTLLPDPPKPSILGGVLALFEKQFAWHGIRDLAADIVMEGVEEETLVESLAQYLWAHRDSCNA